MSHQALMGIRLSVRAQEHVAARRSGGGFPVVQEPGFPIHVDRHEPATADVACLGLHHG